MEGLAFALRKAKEQLEVFWHRHQNNSRPLHSRNIDALVECASDAVVVSQLIVDIYNHEVGKWQGSEIADSVATVSELMTQNYIADAGN